MPGSRLVAMPHRVVGIHLLVVAMLQPEAMATLMLSPIHRLVVATEEPTAVVATVLFHMPQGKDTAGVTVATQASMSMIDTRVVDMALGLMVVQRLRVAATQQVACMVVLRAPATAVVRTGATPMPVEVAPTRRPPGVAAAKEVTKLLGGVQDQMIKLGDNQMHPRGHQTT